MEYENLIDEWPVTGDNPGGENLLSQAMRDRFNDLVADGSAMLPNDYEIVTDIDGNEGEIPAESIKLSLGQKAHEYTVTLAKEAADHKKEIAASAITTISMVGLFFAIQHMRPQRKAKK